MYCKKKKKKKGGWGGGGDAVFKIKVTVGACMIKI